MDGSIPDKSRLPRKLKGIASHPFALAAVAAVLGSLTTFICTRIFPSVQTMYVVSPTGAVPTGIVATAAVVDPYPSRYPKIRENMPPYAFELQFLQHSPAAQTGFLNLVHVPPAWIYRLDMVNLTTHTIPVVDVSIEFKGQMKWLAVSNADKLLYESPDDAKAVEQLLIEPPKRRIVASFKPLLNAHALTATVVIYAESRPDINDFNINARCSDGNFVQITPDAYAAIGWQHE